MLVTLMNRERMYSLSLPEKTHGQFWLFGDQQKSQKRAVSIEGLEDRWIIKSTKWLKIIGEGGYLRNAILTPMSVIYLQGADDEKSVVFVEPDTTDRQRFAKFMFESDIEITVGRAEDSDIRFNYQAVSSNHAVIYHSGGKWIIMDNSSTNGTFINNLRISSTQMKELQYGDTVFIMGLKLVFGKDFIALNNPDGKISFSKQFRHFVAQQADPVDLENEYELDEKEYFYRSPRFKREVETAEFRIDSPPSSPVSEEMPWILVMGSSLAMGMMSVVTLSNAIAADNMTAVVMGGSMLVGTMVLPVITKIYERRHKHKKEAKRQERYKQYLEKVNEDIVAESHSQTEILYQNSVSPAECENRIANTTRNLWERTANHNDFLLVRVGIGDKPLDAEFSYQEQKFSIEEDNLVDEMYALCEKPKILTNIPITYSLFDNYISGIIGNQAHVSFFVKNLIIQLAALYSYDEVKFVFLYDESQKEDYEFVKWLPHVWSADNKFRFVATNVNEAKEVSAYLESIVAYRSELNENDLKDCTPYFVVFSLSKQLTEKTDAIRQVLSKKENLRFSVVAVCGALKDLPKECSVVVELSDGTGRIFNNNDTSGNNIPFKLEKGITLPPEVLSKKLLNTQLDIQSLGDKLPRMVTFLEMFGVGKVEHLNALTRWKENDPTKTLEAAVGVDTQGELFKLDLHEKFHGPHGLVAGMTGSGKSEFIITYILSLAVNYHPNEVAFILIDYKGGGMAKSFENLPHTAGIITNLDGSAIKRSLVSIESELRRRQAVFAAASKKVGVSNIDIYKYQKLYRQGTVSEPLQHLFIISDEFAELKTQQPEFMAQLVSAARIGRSLGVHLILATQKPSGVVDDQIWSNSKFRVCLKVQERADSMDMLKRPDAAELTDTGRFYLQVGYNELFELGQSAWAGAPYYPSDKVIKEKDNSVVVIDMNGHTIREAKIDHRRAQNANAKKQLDVITEYLENIATEEGIKIRPLWLEPIPAVILLDDLKAKYSAPSERFVLNPVIGEYDDPARQSQHLLRLPISEEGNVVVYGSAGSGKTSFVNTMVYSLIHEHSPEEVNIYLLDFAAETLRAFAKAPHVGDVIFSYEAEKISNLFKMIRAEVEKRKKLFADYGGDYASYIKSSGKELPSIVVVIHNYAAFTELYEEKEDAVSLLSREGTKYGIFFVLTALGSNGVRFRLLQNFKQLITLQLNDEGDYSTIVGKTEGLFPSKFKGRGLFRRGDLFEFQTASLTTDENVYMFLVKECQKLADSWNSETARKIPVLPDVVNTEFLRDYINSKQPLSIPVGVEKNTLEVHNYPFVNNYITVVSSVGDECEQFTAKLGELIGNGAKVNGIVFDAAQKASDTGNLTLVSSAKDCENAVNELFDKVLYRNNTYKDALEQKIPCEEFEDTLVIIDSLSKLRDFLGEETNAKLSLILEKGSINYKIWIILGDNSKSISQAGFEKWYKANVSAGDGIWIGNGITEQYNLKANKTTAEMREEIPDGFGYSIIRGKAVKVKLLSEKTEGGEDEE